MSEVISKQFDQLGGTIGRAIGNGLILEDPSKYISRTHARIELLNGSYVITDIGSNPSFVNDRPIGIGGQIILNQGDNLTIGDYQLSVNIISDAVEIELPRSPLQVEPVPQQEFNKSDSLLDAKILDVGGSFNTNPLGLNQFSPQALIPDILSTGSSSQSVIPAFRGTESDHISPEIQPFSLASALSVTPSVDASPGMTIPDDYDPLADFLPPRVSKPFAPLAPQQAVRSTPEVFPEFESTPIAASLSEPAVRAVPVQTTAVPDGEVIQALLRGLQLPDLKVNLSAPEFVELVGAMLREATKGTMDVLMARTMTKREGRLEMTMLAAQANNPLKFFPDAESAMTQMLSNTMAGYMPSVHAFGNAYDDLKAHELAVLAGMRAALSSILHRFDPIAIEEKLKVPSVMDKVLVANRKAKMWDGLVELYDEISREADNDFQRLFGEKFAKAYEEQIQRLRQAKI